jgi:hypothetical protein
MLAVLVMTRSALGFTVRVAVIKLGLAPTEVDNEPAGTVLAACGDVTEVTTAEIEQVPLGAMTVPAATDIWLAPAVATGAGPEHVVAGLGVVAFSRPAGYSSMNAVLNVADTSLWVFVKVITNNDVPPAVMVLGVKVLATWGKLAVTGSPSVAVQVPEMQLVAVLVLVTPAGAVIDAVLVICVCAKATCGMDREIKKPITSDKMLNTLGIENFESFKRLNTFAMTGMGTPSTIYIVVI